MFKIQVIIHVFTRMFFNLCASFGPIPVKNKLNSFAIVTSSVTFSSFILKKSGKSFLFFVLFKTSFMIDQVFFKYFDYNL